MKLRFNPSHNLPGVVMLRQIMRRRHPFKHIPQQMSFYASITMLMPIGENANPLTKYFLLVYETATPNGGTKSIRSERKDCKFCSTVHEKLTNTVALLVTVVLDPQL